MKSCRRADALDVGENLAAEAAAKKEKTLQRYQSLFLQLGFQLKLKYNAIILRLHGALHGPGAHIHWFHRCLGTQLSLVWYFRLGWHGSYCAKGLSLNCLLEKRIIRLRMFHCILHRHENQRFGQMFWRVFAALHQGGDRKREVGWRETGAPNPFNASPWQPVVEANRHLKQETLRRLLKLKSRS